MNKETKQYFASVPEQRRSLIEMLHRLIVELYPEASIDMSYRMPTYRAKDGWVAIANQKRYVSLYTCGAHHLTDFKKKHPNIKTGKGCINFETSEGFPVLDVKAVIAHAIEHPK